MNTVIRVNNVSKTFGSVKAVQDLCFEVDSNTCFGFLGPNGAGKTTMMKMIYAKCARDADCPGTIDVFGYDPAKNELAIKYLSGVVQQEDNLDEELNVIQNLMIYSRFYDMPRKIASERIASLLEFLELTEKAKSKIRELSGGMKRRLVIARALLNDPKLLILDEPTTGLDPQVRHLIWDKLRKLKKQGTTLLLTTHYMEEAFQLCDNLLIMHQGKNIMQGRPIDLLKQNIERFVLELFDVGSMRSDVEKTLDKNIRVDHSRDVTRFYCNDIDQLKTLADPLKSGHYHIREANLEDVFLKATGRQLNAKQ